MQSIFRSAKEAVGTLTEEALPGDFVRVRSADPTAEVFGRVLAPDDPSLESPVPAGRVPVVIGEDNVQQFDPNDIEKVDATELPSELLAALSGQQGNALVGEVLADLDPEMVEEFDLADPMKSMANKLAQRMPDVRNRKSRAMKRNWRRAKGRSVGDKKLGNEPDLMQRNPALKTFESLVEQVSQGFGAYGVNSDVMAGTPGNMGGGTADDEDEILGQDAATFEGSNAMDPEVAFNLTTRVFEASNDIMKSLSLSQGLPYFTWLQDDPEEGVVRVKINGVCPKEIVEKFVRGLKDMDIVEVEHPEGTRENNDLTGSWVFQTQLPGFPDFEEPEYEPEQPQYGQSGEAPGEIVIPEEPVAGMG